MALALSAATSVAPLAPWIIHLLYGEAFAASVPVLQIACWGGLFILPAALYAVFRSTRPLFFITIHALLDWFIPPWRSLRKTRQLSAEPA